MVTIEVTNANGRRCKVQITWGMTHSRGWTDTNGRVSFDVSPGRGKIYVDGKKVYEGEIKKGTKQVRK